MSSERLFPNHRIPAVQHALHTRAIPPAQIMRTSTPVLLKTERFEPVLIGNIPADVADAFEPIAEDQGMTIALVLSSPETVIKGDRALLNHCPRKTHIDLSVSTDPDQVTLTVSDNGPGIDKDIREKVLQRF